MPKSILIGISPNTESDDVWLAWKLLFFPGQWQTGPALPKLEAAIKKYYPRFNCYLVNAGRTALYLGLKSLKLQPGDEVVHLDFTCDVVPEAIIRAGGKPVPIKDLTKPKITSRTKALICQHTFGIPDDLDKIQAFCRRHRLVLIEDCAHSLGARYQGKYVGNFGDMSILSFGRDKVISSVFGGALLSKKSLALSLQYPSRAWIAKQLFHPLLMAVAVPTYFWLGKYLIYLARKVNLITLPLNRLADNLLPNALAELALHQWHKLDYLNRHRQNLARFYAQNLNLPFDKRGIYLRYPVKVARPRQVIADAKRQQMLLGNWYDFKILNLPTHIRINLNDARRVMEYVRNQTNK